MCTIPSETFSLVMILSFRFGQVLYLEIAWLLLFGIAVLRRQLLQLYGKHLGLNPVLVS